MRQIKNHIIHKWNFELNTNSEEENNILKEDSMSLLKEKIIPTIEKVFDTYGMDEVIRIEHLELNLAVLNSGNLESRIIEQIQKQLPYKMQTLFKEENALKIKKSWIRKRWIGWFFNLVMIFSSN